MAVWNGKNAGRNDNLLHEKKARACVRGIFIGAVAHRSLKSLNFVKLFGNEIKFQAIEEVG